MDGIERITEDLGDGGRGLSEELGAADVIGTHSIARQVKNTLRRRRRQRRHRRYRVQRRRGRSVQVTQRRRHRAAYSLQSNRLIKHRLNWNFS